MDLLRLRRGKDAEGDCLRPPSRRAAASEEERERRRRMAAEEGAVAEDWSDDGDGFITSGFTRHTRSPINPTATGPAMVYHEVG